MLKSVKTQADANLTTNRRLLYTYAVSWHSTSIAEQDPQGLKNHQIQCALCTVRTVGRSDVFFIGSDDISMPSDAYF